ncbi:hypothetical protein WDU94_005920 [Cyamophila willieti]
MVGTLFRMRQFTRLIRILQLSLRRMRQSLQSEEFALPSQTIGMWSESAIRVSALSIQGETEDQSKDACCNTTSGACAGEQDLHSGNTDPFTGSADHLPPFPCSTCGKVYQSKSSLERHRKWECGKDPVYQCPQCPYKAKQRATLTRHRKNKHEESVPDTAGAGDPLESAEFVRTLMFNNFAHGHYLDV